jgi:hypothetical protein
MLMTFFRNFGFPSTFHPGHTGGLRVAKKAKKKTARKSKRGVTSEIAQYARSSARAVTKTAKKMMGTKKKKKASR